MRAQRGASKLWTTRRSAARKFPNLFQIMEPFGIWWKYPRKKCAWTRNFRYNLSRMGRRFSKAWNSFTEPLRIHTRQVKDLWTEFWIYANLPSGEWSFREFSSGEDSVLPRIKGWQKHLSLIVWLILQASLLTCRLRESEFQQEWVWGRGSKVVWGYWNSRHILLNKGLSHAAGEKTQ